MILALVIVAPLALGAFFVVDGSFGKGDHVATGADSPEVDVLAIALCEKSNIGHIIETARSGVTIATQKLCTSNFRIVHGF
ncbi:hypothetical protein NY055_04145 [Corynebacterium diphtheriae bv. mitis]|nr:hypothetical protein NY055_04145 [Corynebacterium diphtheriae bv. mitis]